MAWGTACASTSALAAGAGAVATAAAAALCAAGTGTADDLRGASSTLGAVVVAAGRCLDATGYISPCGPCIGLSGEFLSRSRSILPCRYIHTHTSTYGHPARTPWA